MPNSNVSRELKTQLVTDVLTINESVTSWLDKLASQNNTCITNSDSITNQTFSIFDAAKSNNRIIKLDKSNISLTSGVPRLTTDGLELTLLPTFNFMCGDIIKIDNSIIDIGVSNKEGISQNLATRFNQKGEYMIYQMEYVLQNRGSSFELKLLCKNRDRIAQFIGGTQEWKKAETLHTQQTY